MKQQNLSNRYYVLGILMLTYTFSIMDRQIVAILVEDLRLEFDLSDVQLGMLTGIAFALLYAVLGIPIARLADRSNRIKIVSISVAIWSAMTALCGMAGSYLHLFLARVGVGIGEAGGVPPAHSVITDYFDRKERGTALSIYSAGTSLGGFLGLVIGGYIAEHYGWRWAFYALGLPGLLLALVTWLTVREPPRGRFDSEQSHAPESLNFAQAAAELWGNLVYRRIIFGHVMAVLVGYSVFGWLPALFMREYGLGQSETGFIVGMVIFGGGIPGLLLGGFLGDRLGSKDLRWRLYIPFISLALAAPLAWLSFMSGNALSAAVFMGLCIFSYKVSWGPHLALVQEVVPAAMRAQAAAYAVFATNIVGLGVGPVLVGLISDALKGQYGEASLTIALSIAAIAFLLGAFCYFWALKPLSRKDATWNAPTNQEATE